MPQTRFEQWYIDSISWSPQLNGTPQLAVAQLAHIASDLGNGQVDHWHSPDDIKKNICVVNLAIHTVIVQRNDIVQLRDRDVHICVVTGIQ